MKISSTMNYSVRFSFGFRYEFQTLYVKIYPKETTARITQIMITHEITTVLDFVTVCYFNIFYSVKNLKHFMKVQNIVPSTAILNRALAIRIQRTKVMLSFLKSLNSLGIILIVSYKKATPIRKVIAMIYFLRLIDFLRAID